MTTCSVCGEPNDDAQAACTACGTDLRAGPGAANRGGSVGASGGGGASGSLSAVPASPGIEPTAPRALGNENRHDMIASRYELIEILGRGGVGVVYRARDRELNEMIAIKLLAGPSSSDPQEVERFKREIVTARRITHPNVIRIHDFGMSGSEAFISMEILPGGTLADLIEKQGPVEIARGVAIAIGVSEGLEAAHAQGIVHRDLKPDNVLLDAGGNPKLVDFGLARLATSTTRTVGFSGTPFYMSPEQADGSEVTSRSDLYSLGVLLYELFTGKLPFVADSLVRIAMMHANEPPPAPSAVRADLPIAIEAVLLRALQKDPAMRYARASEICEDLRLFQAGKPLKYASSGEEATATGRAPAEPDARGGTAAIRPTRQPTLTNSKVGGIRFADAPAPVTRGETVVNARPQAIPIAPSDSKTSPSSRGIPAVAAPPPRRPSISRAATGGEQAESHGTPADSPSRDRFPDDERAPESTSRGRVLLFGLAFALAGAFAVYEGVQLVGGTPPRATPSPVIAATPSPSLTLVERADPSPAATRRVDPTPRPTAVALATGRPRATPAPTARTVATPLNLTPVAPTGKGTLVVQVKNIPWARFTLDDAPKIYEAPTRFPLAAGSYVLHVSVPEQQGQMETRVDVRDGRSVTIIVEPKRLARP